MADGGVRTAMTSGAKMLVAAGIVTCLVVTDLMAVMLVLAARIPYVDRAVALRNKLGKWVLFGLLFHAIFLVCGYAMQDPVGVVSEVFSLLGISDLMLSLIALAAPSGPRTFQRPRVGAMPPLVFETMGTVVTLVTVAPLDTPTSDAVQAAFRALDERFSLYQPASEASLVGRDRMGLTSASAEYREMYWAAIAWSEATDRAFTPHRPDGVIDLSGVVKARGIQAAGVVLGEHGHKDWCLNAGGDVLVAGARETGEPWVVGIVDPDDRTKLWTQFATRPGRMAVATSGVQERGEHVWRMAADDTFTQVTVAAADIETADVLATAILAGGVTTLQLAQGTYDIDVLASAHGGRVWASPVFTAS